MSRDKFGRSSTSEGRAIRGPKGEGYNLTPEGDFDITDRLLRNVKTPLIGTDAANMDYVKSVVPEEHTNHWSFKNKRLSNVGTPLYDGEVVTFGTLKSQVNDFNEKVRQLNIQLVEVESKITQIAQVSNAVEEDCKNLGNKVEYAITGLNQNTNQLALDRNDIYDLRGRTSDLPHLRKRTADIEDSVNGITTVIVDPMKGIAKINSRLDKIEEMVNRRPDSLLKRDDSSNNEHNNIL